MSEAKSKSARSVCWTLNNYTPEDETSIQAWDCKYIVYGREVGANGTPHLQGYVEWKSTKLWSTMKALNPRIHWEERRGSARQAALYCKKGEQSHDEWVRLGVDGIDGEGSNFGKNASVFEKGAVSQQGKRTELDEIGQAILDGKPLLEVAASNPGAFIKHSKGIEALHNLTFQPRSRDAPPYVEWRWGLAGVGKTRYCVEKHPTSHYIKDGTMWWPNYTQQEAIIIDDFDGKWPYRDLLRLLDRYEYQGQYKGGYIHINSPFIYITCEHPPSHFWTGNELAQIVRRISKIEHVTIGLIGPTVQT